MVYKAEATNLKRTIVPKFCCLLLLSATNSLHNTIVSANMPANGAAADSYRN